MIMKKQFKKVIAVVLAMAIALGGVLITPQGTTEVQAATTPRFTSSRYVTTYMTGDKYTKYYVVLSIVGCEKASQIKSLKSSSKDITLEKKDGYIRAYFGDKAAKATISCKVNGKKISTVLEVKKYTNPAKTFKIGKTNYASKFKNVDTYKQKKSFKKQKFSITMNKNWKINSVSVYNGGSTSRWTVNSTKFSKTISLTNTYAYLSVYCTNSKTGVSEWLYFYKSNY